ncbi:MAG: hypothetical protein MUP98_15075 [Candidatus Aminicenantes bacterium]|nr:hypothetical protein [Candidatus Aminicenantes bacterium]
MFKRKKVWFGMMLGVLMMLLISTPIFAQDEVDPVDPPEIVEESSSFLDHPIVKLIAEFFADLLAPPGEEVVETDPPDPPADPAVVDPPEDGSSPEEESESEDIPTPEEAVASMHEEDDLGFGEIVKLMGILESACAESEGTCEITYEDLLDEYKNGEGMGALFAKYGKPENPGVGHLRKELNPKEKSNNGKAKGKNK